jgi:mono/diheme cytochrome c family protein
MLRYFFALFALTILVVVSLAGFRGQFFKQPPIEIFPDMDHQPKVKAQVPSQFFADGRGNRLPVPGTVPVGYSTPLRDQATGKIVEMGGPYKQIAFGAMPDYFNTGKIGDRWGTGIPLEVTMEVMERGRERYNISCKVCHGAVGLGNGIASQFGLAAVANLQIERIRVMADGEIYNTITHGKNTMMGYGHNIQVEDRWAIVAYLRAMQLAQNSTIDAVPPGELAALQAEAKADEAVLQVEETEAAGSSDLPPSP